MRYFVETSIEYRIVLLLSDVYALPVTFINHARTQIKHEWSCVRKSDATSVPQGSEIRTQKGMSKDEVRKAVGQTFFNSPD